MEDSDGDLIIGVDPDNKEFPIALFWDDGSEDAIGMTLYKHCVLRSVTQQY